MTTPLTDDRLAEWEEVPVLRDHNEQSERMVALIQEVRRLRAQGNEYTQDAVERAIRRAEKAEARVRKTEQAEEIWRERALRAEAERDGLRDELTVALAKATDLMTERDRYRQMVEKIADLGRDAQAALNQQEPA